MAMPIWSMILTTGFRVIIGSWKTIEISLPRILRSSRSFSPTSSRPLNLMELPGWMLPFVSSNPISEKPVIDLPEPDSPTRPITSPRSSVKEMPSTDLMVPLSVWK